MHQRETDRILGSDATVGIRRQGRRSSLYLLVALVLWLLLYPYLYGLPGGGLLLGLLGAAIPVAAIYAFSRERRTLVISIMLGVPTLIIMVAGNIATVTATDAQPLPRGFYGLAPLAFYGYATVHILYHVLRDQEVTTDTLFAAVAGYLLLGLTWTSAYLLVEHIRPNSFTLGTAAQAQPFWTAILYYSFVTLTTLGYGDITPTTPHAQSMAMLEAISGVMYAAVLIARLVGARPPRTPSAPGNAERE